MLHSKSHIISFPLSTTAALTKYILFNVVCIQLGQNILLWHCVLNSDHCSLKCKMHYHPSVLSWWLRPVYTCAGQYVCDVTVQRIMGQNGLEKHLQHLTRYSRTSRCFRQTALDIWCTGGSFSSILYSIKVWMLEQTLDLVSGFFYSVYSNCVQRSLYRQLLTALHSLDYLLQRS